MRDYAVALTNATSTCAVRLTSSLTSLAGQSPSLQEATSKWKLTSNAPNEMSHFHHTVVLFSFSIYSADEMFSLLFFFKTERETCQNH